MPVSAYQIISSVSNLISSSNKSEDAAKEMVNHCGWKELNKIATMSNYSYKWTCITKVRYIKFQSSLLVSITMGFFFLSSPTVLSKVDPNMLAHQHQILTSIFQYLPCWITWKTIQVNGTHNTKKQYIKLQYDILIRIHME